jgi:hypothetical protein
MAGDRPAMRFSLLFLLIYLECLAPLHAAELPPLRRGVNTFPWIYRAQTVNDDGRTFDYEHLFPYFAAFRPSHFLALRAAGIDFVRVIVDPGPFLAADSEPKREKLIAQVIDQTRKASEQGLAIVIDLHPRESAKDWRSRAILASKDLQDRYQATVAAFAGALAHRSGYVLELMNEPPGGYSAYDSFVWPEFQIRLVKAARAVAPELPLVVTGDRGGGPDGLVRLDAGRIDDEAIIYSFHYYLPMAVTHQGARWTSKVWRQYLSNVPYPPDQTGEAPTLARVRDAIFADKSIDDSTRRATWEEARAALLDYFRDRQAVETIRADFARVAAWAKQNHVPSSRVLLGEFGVFRPGASLDSAAKWARDVRATCENNGFAWAYFNYAPFDENGQGFSLLRMTGPTPNALDSRMLSEGLGLRAAPWEGLRHFEVEVSHARTN